MFNKIILPAINIISVALIGLLSIWLSHWISATELVPQDPAADLDKNFTSFWDLIASNIFSFSTPVPWFAIAFLSSLFSSIENLKNRYEYGKNQELANEIRREVQAHGTSKRYYYEALQECLKYLLANDRTGIDEVGRVTVYRMQKSEDKLLKKIFRYSKHHTYNHEGRIRIPNNQGVVGCAWHNHGRSEFKSQHNPETNAHQRELERHVNASGCEPVSGNLSMPSKHIIARAIADHDSTQKVAIVVFESTEQDRLSLEGIDEILVAETLNVSRYIKHLGILDEELNPDPREVTLWRE